MIRKKICLVGAPGVGKTSLVRRFVERRFEADYHSTIGVRIDRRGLEIDGDDVSLIIWDIHGEDESLSVRSSYLAGMAGCFVVIDASRPDTIDVAETLRERALAVAEVPMVAVINKIDLVDDAEVAMSSARLAPLADSVMATSCLEDTGVDEAFEFLARATIG